MFDLERFKVQLGQTIAWCMPRVSADDPSGSLRTTLPPYAENVQHDDDLVMRLVEPVIQLRAIFLELDYKIEASWKRPRPTLPSGLAGGRLLVFYPSASVSDPAAGVESNGFFSQASTTPACDTWVYGGKEPQLLSYGYDDLDYLICWIPPQIVALVDSAIDVDPTECMEWLSKTTTPFSFLALLKSEGFLT